VAILLLAVGLLLALCLVSPLFIRATLLEFSRQGNAQLGRLRRRECCCALVSVIGLAAYLLPLYCWPQRGGAFARAAFARPFPACSPHTPDSICRGAALNLQLPPLFDSSVQPGEWLEH